MSSVLARSGWFIASTSPVQVRVRSALARQSWGYYCTCGCAVSFYAPVGNLWPLSSAPPLCSSHLCFCFPSMQAGHCKWGTRRSRPTAFSAGEGEHTLPAAMGLLLESLCALSLPLLLRFSFFSLFFVVLLCTTPHVWMMPNVVGYPSCRFHPSCFHILLLMKLYGRESITCDLDRIAFAI